MGEHVLVTIVNHKGAKVDLGPRCLEIGTEVVPQAAQSKPVSAAASMEESLHSMTRETLLRSQPAAEPLHAAPPRFPPGARIEIADGPLRGLRATVLRVRAPAVLLIAADGWEPGALLLVSERMVAAAHQ